MKINKSAIFNNVLSGLIAAVIIFSVNYFILKRKKGVDE